MNLNIGAEYKGFRTEVSGLLAKNGTGELLGNKEAETAFRRVAVGRSKGMSREGRAGPAALPSRRTAVSVILGNTRRRSISNARCSISPFWAHRPGTVTGKPV